MEQSEIAKDIWQRVAELDKVPPEDKFDPDLVWARLQAKMEAKRKSSLPRGVIYLVIAVFGVIVALGIGVALNKNKSQDATLPQQPITVDSLKH